MRLDTQEFPLLWMRDHLPGEGEDHGDEIAALRALIEQGERFILLASRIPTLADMSDDSPAERKERALLFKEHKVKMARLCAGMILIGKPEALPLILRKPLQALAGLIGAEVIFAPDEAAARLLAKARLAG